MKVLLFKEKAPSVKVMAFCCRSLSRMHQKGNIVEEELCAPRTRDSDPYKWREPPDQKYILKLQGRQSTRAVMNYCPLCGTKVDIQYWEDQEESGDE